MLHAELEGFWGGNRVYVYTGFRAWLASGGCVDAPLVDPGLGNLGFGALAEDVESGRVAARAGLNKSGATNAGSHEQQHLGNKNHE